MWYMESSAELRTLPVYFFVIRQRHLVLKELVYWFINSNNRQGNDAAMISCSRPEPHEPSEKTPDLFSSDRI